MTETGACANWIVWLFAFSPVWIAVGYAVWESDVRPRLIPKDDIDALADNLIALHGPHAEDVALTKEYRAWRHSRACERGQWHRVRRELWRRYEDGDWEGPED
jgi:hypothetical protein